MVFLGYFDKYFKSDGPNYYVYAKSTQLFYALFYLIGIMLAYFLRQVDSITSLYELKFWVPSFVFTLAYGYMQVDELNDKQLVPEVLHVPLRILAFAILLTTLSQTAFHCILLTIAVFFLYICVSVSSFSQPQLSHPLLLPTLLSHVIYIGLLIYNGLYFGFDYIAGWIILLSITLKISFMTIIERYALQGDHDNQEYSISDYSEEEIDDEDLSLKDSLILRPVSSGFVTGRMLFKANFFSALSAIIYMARKIYEEM